MKIGLLECDHVLDKFQHIAGDYRDMFPALFPELNFELFDVCNGQFPSSVNDCDAYICTGSKYSVYDDIAWIQQLKTFVKRLYKEQKPFVGVCFGHQMIAEALGGKVQKAEVGWCIGTHTFQVLKREPWMIPFQSEFNLLMLCQDQVQILPENSTVLTQTADCPIGMFRVGENMLGIQAHPEFPKAYIQEVIRDRIERLGIEKVEKGMASLSSQLHRMVIAQWAHQFLCRSDLQSL